LAYYLTHRRSNDGELESYFPLWRNLSAVIDGAFRIIDIEYDRITTDVRIKFRKERAAELNNKSRGWRVNLALHRQANMLCW